MACSTSSHSPVARASRVGGTSPRQSIIVRTTPLFPRSPLHPCIHRLTKALTSSLVSSFRPIQARPSRKRDTLQHGEASGCPCLKEAPRRQMESQRVSGGLGKACFLSLNSVKGERNDGTDLRWEGLHSGHRTESSFTRQQMPTTFLTTQSIRPSSSPPSHVCCPSPLSRAKLFLPPASVHLVPPPRTDGRLPHLAPSLRPRLDSTTRTSRAASHARSGPWLAVGETRAVLRAWRRTREWCLSLTHIFKLSLLRETATDYDMSLACLTMQIRRRAVRCSLVGVACIRRSTVLDEMGSGEILTAAGSRRRGQSI